MSGSASITGAIGATTAIASLSVGLNSTISANVKTTGSQTFSGAVTLGANVTLTSSGGAGIISAASIDGDGALTRTLSVAAGTGAFAVGAMGASKALGASTITANSISFTAGASSIHINSANLTLQGATASTSIDVGDGTGSGTLKISSETIKAVASTATNLRIGYRTGITGTSAVTVIGAISPACPLTLRSASAGSITVNNTITAASATGVTLNSNGITTLAADISTAGGAISLTGTGGGVYIGAGSVTLTSGSGNPATAGAISFGTKTASASVSGASLILDSSTTGGTGGAVTIGAFNSAAGNAVQSLTVKTIGSTAANSGTLADPLTYSLVIPGTTTIDIGSNSITTLTNASNNFGTVAITSAKNVTLTDTNAIVFGASTLTGTLTVTAGGAITQSGAISATTLSAPSSGGITLSSANSISNFTVAVTTAGDVSLTNTASPLTITSGGVAGYTGRTVSISNTGAIVLSDAVNASSTGTVSLDTGGTATITGSGTITGSIVNLQTGTGSGMVGTNGTRISTSGTTTLNLGNTTTGLAGAYVSHTGALTLGTLDLATNNPLSVVASGLLTLPSSAIATGSGILVLTSGTSLTPLAALSSTTSIALTASGGTMSLGYNVTGGTVSLSASSTISQSGGTISGSTLTTSSSGGATLTSTTNSVTGFTATNTGGGAIQLTDAASGLALSGVTQSGTAGSVTILCNTSGATLMNSGSIASAGGAVSLTADNMDLGSSGGGEAINAGSGGSVTILPATASRQISLGADTTSGTLGLSDTELDTITTTSAGTLTVGSSTSTYTGGVIIDGDLSCTTNIAGPVVIATAGAVTRPSTGTISSTGVLTLTAASGIGASGTPIYLGSVGGLSATNSTSNDIYIVSTVTSAITLGSSGYSITETPSAGTLSVVASGDIEIDGDMTVLSGTIKLDATGTITEYSAGTLSASTVKLGTAGSTKTVGVSGAPIVTASTTLLSAAATSGAGVYLSNTGDVNLIATATSGAVSVANSGTTTTAGVISAGTTVSVSSSDALSIGHAVTGASGVMLTVTGSGKALTHTAGAISSTNSAITLEADSMDLGLGTVSSGTANTYLLPYTNSTASSLGGSAGFDLSATELNLVSAGTIVVGEDSSATRTAATMTVAASAVNLGTKNLTVSADNIQGGGNTLTAATLTLKAANGIGSTTALSSAASTIAFANTAANAVSVTNTKAAGVSASGTNAASAASVTLVETSGALTVNSSGVTTTGGGALSLTANDMTITGSVTAGTSGAVSLTTYTAGNAISLGSGSSGLGLSSTELNKVATSGTLTIGDSAHTGTISADGDLSLSGPTGAVVLQTAGGNIALSSYALITAGALSLSTTGSSATTGSVAGTGQLTVGSGGVGALTVSAGAGINLTNAANRAATVSLANSTSGDIVFSDNESMTLSSAVNSHSAGNVSIVNGNGTLSLGTVTSTGPGYVSLSSAGAANQSAVITAPGGLLLLGAGSYALDTRSNVVSTLAVSTSGSGAVAFNSSSALTVGAVNGTSGVTTAGGNVTLTTAAGNLTVSEPINTSAGSSGAGTVTLTPSGSITLSYATAVITTNNAAVTLSKAVTLGTDATITSGTATTAFSSTVDGGQVLKVDGAASFGGVVGSTPLTSIEVTGATTTGLGCTAIKTSGVQTYAGSVLLGDDAALTASPADFGASVDGGGHSLVITGAATLGGAASDTFANLTSLSVTGACRVNAQSITTTTGGQTYASGGSPTTLASAATTATAIAFVFTAPAAQTVRFCGTLLSYDSTARSVHVKTGGARFDGAVGSASYPVSTLTVDGATALHAGAVTTTGNQYFTGATTLYADAVFTSAAASTVRFGGLLNSSGSNWSAHVVTAAGRFDAAVGSALALSSLTVDGAATLYNGVHTTTTQTYSGTVSVAGDATFYSDGISATTNLIKLAGTTTIGNTRTLTLGNGGATGAFSLAGVTGGTSSGLTVNTTGDVTITGAVSGLSSLTVTDSGNTTFDSTVGATTVTLTATTGTAIFSGALTATTLSVGADVVNVALSASSGTITNAVDFLNTGTLALGQASGTLTFNGGLATTGHATNPATVTTYGTILTSDDAISLGAITLGADTTLDTAATSSIGAVALGAVTGGSYALVIRTGTSSGSVTQSAGGITANKLRIITGGNIGSSTTALSTAVSYFEGEAGGLVNVSNTGDLTEGFSGGSFDIAGTLSGSNGAITLITTANLTVSEAITANGSGAVSLTANSASKTLAVNAAVSSTSGAMTLTGDVISIGAALTSAGALTLQPLTAGTTVSIGAAGGTFAIDDTEIGYLSDGFSSITIGRSSSGVVTVDTATFKDPVTILSGGMVTIAAGGASLSTSKDNASITVTSATGAGIIVNGGIAANGSGAVDINSGAAFTLDSGVAISSSSGTVTVDTTGANTLEVDGSIATAGTGAIGLTGSNAITMGAAGNVQTASGAITINSAAGGVTTHSVTSTGSGQISITATGSSIVQTGSSPLIGYSSGTSLLALTAGTTIGSLSSPLATSIGTLRMTAAGDAYLYEADGLVLGDGTVGVKNEGGLVSIAAGGAITMGAAVKTIDFGSTARAISLTGSSLAVSQNVSAANAGTITLIASSGAITRNAGVVGASGSASLLVLSAGTSIGSDTGSDNVADSGWLATDVGTIRATASSGGIYIDEANAIQLADGSGGVLATGNIDVTAAAGSITTGTGAIQSSGSSVYLEAAGSSSMLTINDSLGASAIIGLTAPFGITVSGSATVTGGSGLMTFNNAVTHSAGAIAAGAGGIAFIGNYAASNSASLAGNASGPIAFWGNASFANFSHNSGAIAFTGLTAQSFLTNAQPIYNMGLNNGAKATLSLLDDLSFAAGGALTLEKGTLDAKGYSITLGAALSYGNSDAPALKLSDGTLTGGSYDITVGQGSLDASGIATITTTGALVLTNASSIVSVGSGSLSVGDMTVNDGSFVQTGSNASTVASLTVKNGSCAWDSGTLSSSGSITQTGGSLELGAKTVSATTLGINAGSLALGTATLNLSSSPNVISPSSCTDGVTSSINLNYAGGSLELNTGSSYTVGAIEVNENTSLVSASGGTIGVAKALAIAAGKYLYLDASAGSLALDLGTPSASGTLTATGTLQVADSTNTVALAALSSSYPFTYAGTDIAYNGKSITIDDMMASSLDTTIDSGASVTFGGSVTLKSVVVSGTLGTDSMLAIAAGGTLGCGSFSADQYTAVTTGASSLIKASGDVSIAGSFSAPIYPTVSTLEMAGTTQALTVAPEICNLTIDSGSTVTLGHDLALSNDMQISGSLDVSSGSYAIALAGDWTNSGSFAPEAGTVKFLKPATKDSGVIKVTGSNSWYNFDCEVAGQSIHFAENETQTILSPGKFIIQGASGSPITLSRQTADADLGWDISGAPDATKMWQIDLKPGAKLDMAYVTVKYSDARAHPVSKPSNVSLWSFSTSTPPSGYTYLTCYDWISGLSALYGYAEDSDGNGKLDRIRIVAAAPLNGVFDDFNVSIVGDTYTIDASKGTKGFMMVPSGSTLPSGYGGYGYEFFIYLVEKGYNDTGTPITLSIEPDGSLKDSSDNKLAVDTYNSLPLTTIDAAAPRVAYTLALPGQNQVFFHFSEPVYASDGASAVTADLFNADSISLVTTSGTGTSELVVTYSSSFSLASIAAGDQCTLSSGISDALQSPTNYATGELLAAFIADFNCTPPAPCNPALSTSSSASTVWPTPIASATHRVSDLLISAPPTSSAAPDYPPYFIWPVWAKDSRTLSLSELDSIDPTSVNASASTGIGLIRAFDGSQWLRDQDITVGVKLADAISASALHLYYDSGVSSTYLSTADNKGPTGLWLPTFAETSFSGIVPFADPTATSLAGTAGSGSLWTVDLDSSDSRVKSGAVIQFLLAYGPENTTDPLYCARLDMTAGGTVPDDWYRLVKPFSFQIHDVRNQKGSVTVLNNVIDPSKGETVRLSYQIPDDGAVTVTVFTLDGDVVKRLYAGKESAGDYSTYWDGKNLNGAVVARGIYFVRVIGPGVDELRKVLVVRK